MGMQDYLTNMMTLEAEEHTSQMWEVSHAWVCRRFLVAQFLDFFREKIADSLEARLNAKLGSRDISKVKSR